MRAHYCLVLSVAVLSACGPSEEERAAAQAAQETRDAAEALREAAASMESMPGGMVPASRSVAPVSVQTLQAALPELPEWRRSTPTGERLTDPLAFTEAEALYSRGEASVAVKIVDSAFSQMLVAPWAMFLTAGYERESGDGYERALSVGGNPGFERWNRNSRTGELNLVIAKRYLVSIEGSDLDDPAVLREFASRIQADTLSSSK